ncbi:MAG: hypothetical protein Q9187_000111 [Circinaria calcarea]
MAERIARRKLPFRQLVALLILIQFCVATALAPSSPTTPHPRCILVGRDSALSPGRACRNANNKHGQKRKATLGNLAQFRSQVEDGEPNSPTNLPATFPAMLDALDVMQSHFFEIWLGIWPTAIDWTAAVMGTQVSTTLNAITSFTDYDAHLGAVDESGLMMDSVTARENLINQYFSHLTSFYFGENAFGLRTQAYDDMLWVVLGWLESISFINTHSELHFESSTSSERNSSWHGRQFIPSFAHRARIFYDLASRGWDTSLCGGGMIWSPYLAPYKNAITNQLYISASISMYLYFPGDDNTSPFLVNGETAELPKAKEHDEKYLEAAIEAYTWLSSSNMTNTKGLYTDGFHIHGWRGGGLNGSIGSGKCDVREEQVYTYNQGVLLSGLRGLWEATGSTNYLEDGHQLVRNVIAATGWPIESTSENYQWAGLGRNGILEEACDLHGTCNQNGQTFKGIFFHHLTLFCAALPKGEKEGVFWRADKDLVALHSKSCREYGGWIRRNAEAAYETRDEEGRFGMWWAAKLDRWVGNDDHLNGKDEGTDYRNSGVPDDDIWQLPRSRAAVPMHRPILKPHGKKLPRGTDDGSKDLNDRGRGRTVETQSGGLAVLRALYRLVDKDVYMG